MRTHEVLDRVRGFALGAVLLGTLLGTQQSALHGSAARLADRSPCQPPFGDLEAGTAWMKLIWTVARRRWLGTARPTAKRMSMRLLREAAWVVAMWMLASSAELLWAFTAYFCLGHAADSWRAEFLHHQNVTKAFWTYYLLAVPFTLTALAGLLVIGMGRLFRLGRRKLGVGCLAGRAPCRT